MTRIIVTGASGVGKTVLIEALAPRLGLPIIPEIGRSLCRSMGYARIGEIPDQEGFKRQVLEAQIAEEDRLGSFISDRSTLDCWVLWQRWNICSAMTYDTESYYRLARSQAGKYTHVVYMPPMFPPPEDGFRWTDPDYQRQIDRLVRATLYEWELLDRTFVVKCEGPEARAGEVMSWLSAQGVC
ncbi:MAG TPA: ATP-binding protein [Candidatus Obscuribacterales bacterium]